MIIIFSILLLKSMAQTSTEGTVLDKETKEPIVGAIVSVVNDKKATTVTDISGRFKIVGRVGEMLRITFLGYKTLTAKAAVNGIYYIQSEIKSLNEVVVTAQESRSLSASSTIGRHAMEHLQPSSFSDLLELLPGGRSSDPSLTAPNTIRLREATPSTSQNYATSSLGTSFVVDGAPISTNANMQYLAGAWEPNATSRDFTNQGVDMRSIATDDIDKVEIVRGIPSVEYGDLTSGLVKIERRRGGNDIHARLKADMGSRLFYLAKGFEWDKRLTLNISADYLDAKDDPRNTLENYKRLTLSARLGKQWAFPAYDVSMTTNLDYSGSFDDEKVDPDLNKGKVDRYKSSYNRMALNFSLDIKMKRRLWFKSFSTTFSTAYQHDLLSRTRLVQLSRLTPALTSLTEGEHNAEILPFTYTATQETDGKPLHAFVRMNARFQVPSHRVSNTLLIGADWNMDKNYGDGQRFDPLLPLYPGTSERARRLSSIPAMHALAFYMEEQVKLPLGGNTLELVAGLRANQLMNLPASYAMHGRWYLDPRANIGWTFPRFRVAGMPSFVRIAAGVGRQTKNPTINYLFPAPLYLDISQLSYYHDNPDYRLINLMTYIIDPTNESLQPARNLKWEVSTDINIGENRLSVTFFREDMTSGFRSNTFYSPFQFKQYDASSLDASTLQAQPDVSQLPYILVSELFGHSEYTNGSRTLKRGIEYVFSSRRIPSIGTRITINGAWFKTLYRNSQTVMYRPSAVVNNRQIQYVGIYKDNDGVENEMANTNFTFDTDIPKLKLGVSLSAQCLWFTSSQRQPLSNEPVQYMSPDGTIHDWQAGDENDTYLRWLIRNNTASLYERYTVPFSMNVNLKVTKKLLNDRLNIAMFCNKIWDYTPDYESNGVTIRRHVRPYFGLETNIKL